MVHCSVVKFTEPRSELERVIIEEGAPCGCLSEAWIDAVRPLKDAMMVRQKSAFVCANRSHSAECSGDATGSITASRARDHHQSVLLGSMIA